LRVQHGFSVSTVSKIAIVYSVGAILGCIVVASLSQKIGRRRAIVGSALLSILVIPLWAFSDNPVHLGIGAFFMQFLVQGCFGVVPAHLNELSPPAIRGMFPGFVYQFGNFLAAGNATIQSLIADRMNHDYSVALAVVPFVGAIVIAGLVGMGREGRDVKMGGEAPAQ
jgi:SHS family lactate transporter-like MFS transporter